MTTNFKRDINKLFEEFDNFIKEKSREGESLIPKEEDFRSFLELNNLNTDQAKTLYNWYAYKKGIMIPAVWYEDDYKTPKSLGSKLKIDYSIKKMKLGTNRFIKKFLAPLFMTSGVAFGVGAGWANASLAAGSKVLGGLITISSSTLVNMLQLGTVGLFAGLAATATVLVSKHVITRIAHNIAYNKSITKDLEAYKNGEAFENLNLKTLLDNIDKANDKILTLRESNNPFKRLYKVFLNIQNRNRIHQLEKFAKELGKIYAETEHKLINEGKSTENIKDELTPIWNLMLEINNFVRNDINGSVLHATLTSKQGKKYVMENIDIYANIANYFKIIGNLDPTTAQEIDTYNKNVKEANKAIKPVLRKNKDKKIRMAEELINGKDLFPQIEDYVNNYVMVEDENDEDIIIPEDEDEIIDDLNNENDNNNEDEIDNISLLDPETPPDGTFTDSSDDNTTPKAEEAIVVGGVPYKFPPREEDTLEEDDDKEKESEEDDDTIPQWLKDIIENPIAGDDTTDETTSDDDVINDDDSTEAEVIEETGDEIQLPAEVEAEEVIEDDKSYLARLTELIQQEKTGDTTIYNVDNSKDDHSNTDNSSKDDHSVVTI